jgi:DNA-binding transcriptional ArsR family regulator
MTMTILFAVEEADFVYLQRECGLTQGNLSSHLSKLEEVGYLTISKSFKGKYPLTICKLTRNGREAFEVYSVKMRFVTHSSAPSKA